MKKTVGFAVVDVIVVKNFILVIHYNKIVVDFSWFLFYFCLFFVLLFIVFFCFLLFVCFLMN